MTNDLQAENHSLEIGIDILQTWVEQFPEQTICSYSLPLANWNFTNYARKLGSCLFTSIRKQFAKNYQGYNSKLPVVNKLRV